MATWQFDLFLEKTEITDADCEAIYAAGCDDGTVVTRDGVTHVAFDREGDSLEEAIGSAIAALMNAGLVVTKAEMVDVNGDEVARHVIWTLDDLVQEELNTYFRHFVALSGCYHAIDSHGRPTGRAGGFHYSGFVLEIGADWYWVTAGHVFEGDAGIRRKLREHKIEVDRCVLNDSFASSHRFAEPIPFSFQDADAIYCCDEQLGLDVAALRLRDNDRKLLDANEVLPLSQDHWQHESSEGFDHFLLIGLPIELEETKIICQNNGYQVTTNPTPVAVYITPVTDVPPDCVRATPRFVGQVHANAGDITGMSGGPIFAVREGDPNSNLVAVQSSWLPKKRLIFGCPIAVVIDRISAANAS